MVSSEPLRVLRAARAAGTRLTSTDDVRWAVGVGAAVAVASSLSGWVSGTARTDQDVLAGRTAFGLMSVALPLVLAAAAGSRANEHRYGVESATRLAVPRAWHRGLGALIAGLALGFAWGTALHLVLAGLDGLVGGRGLAHGALAQSLRAGAATATLAVCAYAVGELVRQGAVAWTIVLAWSTIGERLLSSVPGLGAVAGPVMPLRNADYFVSGRAYGAEYPWDAPAAVLVPALWAAALAILVLARRSATRSSSR